MILLIHSLSPCRGQHEMPRRNSPQDKLLYRLVCMHYIPVQQTHNETLKELQVGERNCQNAQ